jgi:integrase/recombinase XerC
VQEQDRQAVELFFDYLRGEKWAASHTLSSYGYDLNQLQKFCHALKIECWADLKSAEVRQYVSVRHKSGIGAKSIQHRVCVRQKLLKNCQKH